MRNPFKLALFAGVVLAALVSIRPAQADLPFSVWTQGQPIDGRHATQSTVSVSSTTDTTLASTDTARMHVSCQVVGTFAPTTKVYWDVIDVSTNSKYVNLGDYFTPDKPIAWQGAVYALGDGTATVTCTKYAVPDY